MKISKRLLMGLAGILLAGCTLPRDPSVTIDYAGEFYVLMLNESEGISRGYFSYGEENRIWTEDYLEPILGELGDLEVRGIKVLGTAYPDYGNLTVTIDDGNHVVAEETAPKGTQRAIVKYSFKK